MAVPGASDGLSVRPMVPGDVLEVHEVERESFSTPWSLAVFYDALAAREHFRALVARSPEGELLGYTAWFDLGEEFHLATLAVRSARRRRGVGSALLDRILEEAALRGAARVTLEVRMSNEEALGFYRRHGFTPVAMRRNYYEDNGEDAMVLWLPLAGRH